MKYLVKVKPKAQKSLAKIPQAKRKQILVLLASLSTDPYLGKKLAGILQDCYSIRVWPYRIIYKLYKKELLIIVINISHRQGVYK